MSLHPTRREFLAAAGAAACSMAAAGRSAAQPPADRPNLLFILVDDQRNDTLGCAGHPILKTPHIDRLAADGVRFTNAFVNSPICAASRANILTGTTETTHGFTFMTPPVAEPFWQSGYPALLREAGYRTGFVGKFGMTVENAEPADLFDAFEAIDRNPYFKEMPDGSVRHTTELCGDWAVDFLREQPADQPFCLSVSFNAVHAEDSDLEDHFPWPKAVDGMYDDVAIPPPRLGDPAIFENLPEFLKESLNRERWYWRWDTPEKYAENMRAYFRMISGVDRVVGRIRAAVEEQGFGDNTVIIYTADNGYYMGDRGFAGKWSHFEQSLRVPLIVHDPRLPADARGATPGELAVNIDLPLTMLAMAGVDAPGHYQGRDLTPLLEGPPPPYWRRDFFCEHHMPYDPIPKWIGIRGRRYVYARYFEQDPAYEFLHDLDVDPDQLRNFVDDPAYAGILETMRQRCDERHADLLATRDRVLR
jgi:arylsulfatase A-like enzyme